MRTVIHYDRVGGSEETLLLVREPKASFERGEEIVDQDGVAWLVASAERVRGNGESECGLFCQRAVPRPPTPSRDPDADDRRQVAYVWR